MSEERLLMEGKLSGLKRDRKKLVMTMTTLCDATRPMINTSLHDVESMEIATAANNLDDLVMAQAELMRINNQINKLEQSLGN